jgi:hypothetical protein
MKKTNPMNDAQTDWPVTFEQVEKAQLFEMLKATPAQRLAMAEELSKLANAVRSKKRDA